MISFFSSRDKRQKTVARSRGPSDLEKQLFSMPQASPAGLMELGVQDWVKSSRELADGCEVQDIALDTLPAELMATFRI